MLWPELALRPSGASPDRIVAEYSPAIVAAVARRDDFRCRFCGFRSERFQTVVCTGSNPRDLNALVCACIFCEQTSALESVTQMHSGVLIHLPEFEQARLNRIAIECFVARLSNEQRLRDVARRALDAFMARRAVSKARIGTDEVLPFLARLRSAAGAEAVALQTALKDIRLFPLDRRIRQLAGMEHNQFPQILTYWRSANGPYPPGAALPWLHDYEQNPIARPAQ